MKKKWDFSVFIEDFNEYKLLEPTDASQPSSTRLSARYEFSKRQELFMSSGMQPLL